MIAAGTPYPVPVPAHGVHRHSVPRNENSPKLVLRGCGYVNVLTLINDTLLLAERNDFPLF